MFTSKWQVFLLILLNLVSGLAVVYSSFQTRQLFGELQQLDREYQQLQTEWGQLLLEESAWSAPGRVEKIAREKLGMNEPDETQTKVLKVKP